MCTFYFETHGSGTQKPQGQPGVQGQGGNTFGPGSAAGFNAPCSSPNPSSAVPIQAHPRGPRCSRSIHGEERAGLHCRRERHRELFRTKSDTPGCDPGLCFKAGFPRALKSMFRLALEVFCLQGEGCPEDPKVTPHPTELPQSPKP